MKRWFWLAGWCAIAACTSSEGGGDKPPRSTDSRLDPGKLPTLADAGLSGLLPLAGSRAVPRDGGNAVDSGLADGSAGTGPMLDAGMLDATVDGVDGAMPGCEADTYRCGAAGRERCDGRAWIGDPCPLDQPGCSSGECVLRGPSMVKVSSYYVDSTEVTVAQYTAFLDAKDGDTSGQPEVCSWNSSFYAGAPADPDTWPITRVDWCDARAFCAWAGKHLCGAIGGGPVAPTGALNADMSQWFRACGGTGSGTHPNNSPDCNSSGGNGLLPVGSKPGCEGAYPGLFDLEGNAAEWVDSCEGQAGAADVCRVLGGSHVDNRSYCTEEYPYPRNGAAQPFGFRCCSG